MLKIIEENDLSAVSTDRRIGPQAYHPLFQRMVSLCCHAACAVWTLLCNAKTSALKLKQIQIYFFHPYVYFGVVQEESSCKIISEGGKALETSLG